MNILVFVKRVPDTESKIRINPETKSVVEDGLNFVISPYDEFAVEEALRLREAKGGQVTSSCRSAPTRPSTVLKKCLAMGADEAVLIKDEREGNLRRAADRPADRRDRPKAVPPVRPAALRQAVGRRGQRPGAVHGGRAPRPAAGQRRRSSSRSRRPQGTARREIEGAVEKVVFSLPAVVSAQKGLNEPRYETLKGIMAAKKKIIPVVTLAELGLTADDVAAAGRGREDRNAGRAPGGQDHPRDARGGGQGAGRAASRRSQGPLKEADMILVFIEIREGKIKKSSFEALGEAEPAGGRARDRRRARSSSGRPTRLSRCRALRPRRGQGLPARKPGSSPIIPPRAMRWRSEGARRRDRSRRRSSSRRRRWARTSRRGSPPSSASAWPRTARRSRSRAGGSSSPGPILRRKGLR